MSASAVLRRRLANQLREVREAAGLTQEQLAEQGNITLRTVKRAETGENTISDRDLKRWLTACRADPDTRERMVELGKQARRRGGWWSPYKNLLPGPYVQLEAEAVTVRNYQPSLVPGLLHTAEYARLVMASDPGVTPDQIERRVEVRLKRQRRLTDEENPLTLHAMMDEAALHRLGGGPEIMRAQLQHIIEMVELPNVNVRALPFNAGIYPSAGYPFAILGFAHPKDPDLVLVESPAGERYLENAEEITAYHAVYNEMSELALNEEDSTALVERRVRELTS